jgi:ankyrin repeat protein
LPLASLPTLPTPSPTATRSSIPSCPWPSFPSLGHAKLLADLVDDEAITLPACGVSPAAFWKHPAVLKCPDTKDALDPLCVIANSFGDALFDEDVEQPFKKWLQAHTAGPLTAMLSFGAIREGEPNKDFSNLARAVVNMSPCPRQAFEIAVVHVITDWIKKTWPALAAAGPPRDLKSWTACIGAIIQGNHDIVTEALNAIYASPEGRDALLADDGFMHGSLRTTAQAAGVSCTLKWSNELLDKVNPQTGLTPLHVAAETNDIDRVTYLVDTCKVPVHVRDRAWRTPLMLACAAGHTEVVEKLASANGSSTAIDLVGFTAMHHAADNGQLEIVKLLVELGHPLTQADNLSRLPFAIAALKGHLDIVKFMCRNNQDLPLDDAGKQWTSAHFVAAAARGNKDKLDAVVKAMVYHTSIKADTILNGAVPTVQEVFDGSVSIPYLAIAEAIRNDDVDTVKAADLNDWPNVNGWNVWMEAAVAGAVKCTEWFSTQKDLKKINSTTLAYQPRLHSFHVAILTDHVAVLKLIMKNHDVLSARYQGDLAAKATAKRFGTQAIIDVIEAEAEARKIAKPVQ